MIMLELCEGGGAKYAEGGAKLGSPPPLVAPLITVLLLLLFS